jgi:hypothetical protein
MLRPIFALALLLPLAACGGSGEGTTVTIDADSDNGSVVAGVAANGTVSVKLPGFEGAIRLPKFQLTADNFDMNGVKLYPGSTIRNIHVDASDKDGAGNEGVVDVSFVSPATPDTVRAWFREKLAAAGYTLAVDGAGLTGKTEKGDPFALKLAPHETGKTRGDIHIRG